ncbi:MAG TPA: AAA family ATPase [Candidatus Hydrogenedentes bacterium]|nr:MAG: Regulatory protein RepA [Candidatus Hydrogenedentes bacterium ADurb.Bin170]HNZ48178.1 AAA family ATPase [Candidatus Hydrogenedentota bacterium]HOR51449.1 AAA family ATPase [Candidatus Hydrogenedentota bacterium]HPK25248.1 AAA family ATPase [Candidatus Hydrogenedentota bacterium]
MSIAKEKSPSAATPGLHKNVAPPLTEPPSSLPEHTSCFNYGVCVKGRYDGSRELVQDWKDTFTKYLACEEEETEAYLTAFSYGDDFLPHYKQYRSNKGFTGSAFGHFLCFDFDCAEDPSDAIAQAQHFLNHCATNYGADMDAVLAGFSGGKGAHIYFPVPSCAVPSVDFGNICLAIAKRFKDPYNCIDLKIYDHQRIFRLPNTRHPKSGKLKVMYRASDFVELDPLYILNKDTAQNADFLFSDDAGEWLAPVWKAAVNQIEKEAAPLPSRAEGFRDLSGDTVDFIKHGAKEGERNTSLFKAACNLYEMNMTQPAVEKLLAPAARDSGLSEAEIQKTLQSASKHAESARGRFRLHEACRSSKKFYDLVCDILAGADFPPEGDWGELERHYGEHDFPPVGALDSAQFSEAEVRYLAEQWLETWKAQATQEAKKTLDGAGALIERLQVIEQAGTDPGLYQRASAAPPQGNPIFRNGLLPGSIGAIFGSDGIGKGFIILDLMVGYARGNPLGITSIGAIPGKRLSTTYVSYEESISDLKTRLDKICGEEVDYGKLEEEGMLRFSTIPKEPLFRYDMKGSLLSTAFMKTLEKAIIRDDVDLMILDPLASAGGLRDENNNAEMNLIATRLRTLADKTGCSILLVHHTTKEGRASLDPSAGRGASSLQGAMRWIVNFRRNADDGQIIEAAVTKNTHGGLCAFSLGRITSGVIRELSSTEIQKRLQAIEITNRLLLQEHISFLVEHIAKHDGEIKKSGVANGRGRGAPELIKALNCLGKKIRAREAVEIIDMAIEAEKLREDEDGHLWIQA